MRVYMLDDEPSMIDIVKLNFELAGHELDGGLMVPPPPGYDAYLIDVGLPGRNGVDIARDLMERDPKAVILLFSAYDKDHVESWGGGEFTFVSKLTDMHSLPDLVEVCVKVERSHV